MCSKRKYFPQKILFKVGFKKYAVQPRLKPNFKNLQNKKSGSLDFTAFSIFGQFPFTSYSFGCANREVNWKFSLDLNII